MAAGFECCLNGPKNSPEDLFDPCVIDLTDARQVRGDIAGNNIEVNNIEAINSLTGENIIDVCFSYIRHNRRDIFCSKSGRWQDIDAGDLPLLTDHSGEELKPAPRSTSKIKHLVAISDNTEPFLDLLELIGASRPEPLLFRLFVKCIFKDEPCHKGLR